MYTRPTQTRYHAPSCLSGIKSIFAPKLYTEAGEVWQRDRWLELIHCIVRVTSVTVSDDSKSKLTRPVWADSCHMKYDIWNFWNSTRPAMSLECKLLKLSLNLTEIDWKFKFQNWMDKATGSNARDKKPVSQIVVIVSKSGQNFDFSLARRWLFHTRTSCPWLQFPG